MMMTWTAQEVRAFLEHTTDHRLHAAFVVLATTGMRRRECPGLRWADVDLAAGRVSIVQTVIAVNHAVRFGSPKTARGRRTVVLDPGTVAAVREQRQRQLAERLLMGAGFTDYGQVFCRPDGGPLHPERPRSRPSLAVPVHACHAAPKYPPGRPRGPPWPSTSRVL